MVYYVQILKLLRCFLVIEQSKTEVCPDKVIKRIAVRTFCGQKSVGHLRHLIAIIIQLDFSGILFYHQSIRLGYHT